MIMFRMFGKISVVMFIVEENVRGLQLGNVKWPKSQKQKQGNEEVGNQVILNEMAKVLREHSCVKGGCVAYYNVI